MPLWRTPQPLEAPVGHDSPYTSVVPGVAGRCRSATESHYQSECVKPGRVPEWVVTKCHRRSPSLIVVRY